VGLHFTARRRYGLQAQLVESSVTRSGSCSGSHALFPALRFRSYVSVSVTVSVKTVSVLPFRIRRYRSRHIGEWPGWPSRLAGEFPAHLSGWSSRPRRNGNGENRTRSYMKGWTETENVIFLRKLRNSCGILTYERNTYVPLQRSAEIRLRINGNVTLETRR